MKKLLFLGLILPLLLQAQEKVNYYQVEKAKKPVLYYPEILSQLNETTQPLTGKTLTPRRTDVTYPISSSGNAYTLIMSQSTCLTANENTNTIMFTHRGNPGTIGDNVGDIVISYSFNGGTTFSDMVAVEYAELKNNRYPSGVLYNPSGNTDPLNQYAILTGPSHNGATTAFWDNNYFASIKLDGSDQNVEYVANPIRDGEPYAMFYRLNLSAADDGTFHVLSPYAYYDTKSYAPDSVLRREGWVMNGTFNSATKKVDWQLSRVRHNFLKLNYSSTLDYQYVSDYKLAWSQDGSVGYLYFLSRDSLNDTKAMQPIVYKTTDKGQTWTALPVQNFADVSNLADNIRPTRQGTKRPYFMDENDAVVDFEGKLHIFSMLRAASTDHPDSLDYIWIFPQYLFHVYMTDNGWDAELIDTVWSSEVTVDNTWYGSGTNALGWDHRVQASRTTSGKQIFCIWADTDPTVSNINEFPDLKGWGKDLVTGNAFPVKNFTEDGSVAGEAYFHYVSDISFDVNGETFVVPVSIQELGITPLDPVIHHYLYGVTFGKELSISNTTPIQFMEIYPNPAYDHVYIKLPAALNGNAIIEVIDITGKTVYSRNLSLSPSINTINLNLSSLEEGVYFVQLHHNKAVYGNKILLK